MVTVKIYNTNIPASNPFFTRDDVVDVNESENGHITMECEKGAVIYRLREGDLVVVETNE